MKKEDLKAEAKRLRSAIAEMFGIPVSGSQSLELIAKAKNFPNWDAACACADDGVSRPERKSLGGVLWPDAVTLFAEAPDLLRRIRALGSRGGLVLFGGPPDSGRSTTMASVADHLHSIMDGDVLSIANVPEAVSKLAKRHAALADLDIRDVREKIVVIDEVRERDTAYAAARLALRGHLVLTSIHSRSVETTFPRFKALLDDETLAQEIADEWQKVLVLHQVFEGDRIVFDGFHPETRPVVDMEDVRQQRGPLVVVSPEEPPMLFFTPTGEVKSLLDRLSPEDRRAWEDWCAANPHEHDGMKWPGWATVAMTTLEPNTALGVLLEDQKLRPRDARLTRLLLSTTPLASVGQETMVPLKDVAGAIAGGRHDVEKALSRLISTPFRMDIPQPEGDKVTRSFTVLSRAEIDTGSSSVRYVLNPAFLDTLTVIRKTRGVALF